MFKKVCIFAVRDKYNINGINCKKQTKKRIWQAYGCKSPVYSVVSIDLSRSDLPFFIKPNLCFMRDKTDKFGFFQGGQQAVKDLHACNRQSLINSLYNKSIQQLIDDFLEEMDSKNQAYYFILEQGYFEQFRNYCKTLKTKSLCKQN